MCFGFHVPLPCTLISEFCFLLVAVPRSFSSFFGISDSIHLFSCSEFHSLPVCIPISFFFLGFWAPFSFSGIWIILVCCYSLEFHPLVLGVLFSILLPLEFSFPSPCYTVHVPSPCSLDTKYHPLVLSNERFPFRVLGIMSSFPLFYGVMFHPLSLGILVPFPLLFRVQGAYPCSWDL